jgi:phosphatidate cytidylyltransferase
MLKQRVLSAIVFVPIFLGLGYLGGLVFDLFLALVLSIAGFEYARMMKHAGFQGSAILMIAAILALLLCQILGASDFMIYILMAILAIFAVYALVKYEQDDTQAFQSLAIQLFGIFYIGVLGGTGISLNHIQPHGNLWVLASIALVWLVDMGAYFVGSRFGKRPILPKLSPKKTLEGFVGGVGFGAVSGYLIGLLVHSFMPELTALRGAILGLLMGVVAFFGDALMSLLKRTMDVKDTGSLLPGHGGVLDRLDSMLWAFVLGLVFVMFLS